LIKDSEEGIFSWIDWEKMSDLVKFGKKIDKFSGRILSDIQMFVKDESVRSSRREYKFEKLTENFTSTTPDNKKVGKVGKVGKVCGTPENHIYNRIFKSRTDLTKPTNLTKSKSDRELQYYEAPECHDIKPVCSKSDILKYIKERPNTNFKELYNLFGVGSLKFRNELMREGKI